MSKRALLLRISPPGMSILAAFGITSVLIALIGKNPATAIYSMFAGALAGGYGIGATLDLTAVLVLTGLATVIPYSAGIWTIGMEGQLYIGSLTAVAAVYALSSVGSLAIAPAIILGMIISGLYGALAGALKAKLKVNEIVSTLMLNYIALLFLDYVARVGGPLHEQGSALAQTPVLPLELRIPSIGGSTIAPTIIIAVLIGIGVFFLMKRTKFGFELRAMGGNIRAAKYAGMKISRNTILAMFASGALSGLAGCFLVFATTFTVFNGISMFYGYLGIGVALLGSLNGVVVILSGLFFSILNVGGVVMQANTGVPFEFVQSMAAIIIIIILVRPVLQKVIARVV